MKSFANADEPEKLERLCRYISRPAISEQRLSITDHGKVRYELKTPYRDGPTHVFFEPLDFIGKLAALIPPPRLNLTRYFCVFAPKSNLKTLPQFDIYTNQSSQKDSCHRG